MTKNDFIIHNLFQSFQISTDLHFVGSGNACYQLDGAGWVSNNVYVDLASPTDSLFVEDIDGDKLGRLDGIADAAEAQPSRTLPDTTHPLAVAT